MNMKRHLCKEAGSKHSVVIPYVASNHTQRVYPEYGKSEDRARQIS